MLATVTIEQAVLDGLRQLPPARQVEILDFVEFLRHKAIPHAGHRNPIGMFAHLNVKITEDDIAAARDELWGNFPRDVEP